MAKCPSCAGGVKTPFVLNADGWRWLKCGHCGARLERKTPRYVVSLAGFLVAAVALGNLLGRRHIWLAEAVIAAPVIAGLLMLLRPQLQVRKALPEAEIRLRIGGK